jgi:hypothetical protein
MEHPLPAVQESEEQGANQHYRSKYNHDTYDWNQYVLNIARIEEWSHNNLWRRHLPCDSFLLGTYPCDPLG